MTKMWQLVLVDVLCIALLVLLKKYMYGSSGSFLIFLFITRPLFESFTPILSYFRLPVIDQLPALPARDKIQPSADLNELRYLFSNHIFSLYNMRKKYLSGMIFTIHTQQKVLKTRHLLFYKIRLKHVKYFFVQRNKSTWRGRRDVLYVRIGNMLVKLYDYSPKYTDGKLEQEEFFENLFSLIHEQLGIETKVVYH